MVLFSHTIWRRSGWNPGKPLAGLKKYIQEVLVRPLLHFQFHMNIFFTCVKSFFRKIIAHGQKCNALLMLLVHFWCTFGTLLMHCWCTFGALLMHFWCTFDALLMRFWCTFGALLMHFWCTFKSDALLMHFYRLLMHFWWCLKEFMAFFLEK